MRARGWVSARRRIRPPDIVGKLNKKINATLADPLMQVRIANFGYSAFASSPAGFGKFIAEDIQKWAKVVKFAGIRPD
jgi:tripartite-type tricarboxylate transporter receptor subunit TctC